MSEQANSPDGVRRPLTAVFVDIVGSTPLSVLMDDEDYSELIGRYRTLSSTVVGRFEGFIPRDEGDGRFIWFGWPTAQRDDADRSVNMALALMDEMQPLSQQVQAEFGRPLELRIGIHTGPAIITFPNGADFPDISSATVNFAAKVQGAAEPGQILVTEATAAALRNAYPLEPAGNVSIDGLDGGINVLRVAGPPSSAATPSAPKETVFVGRELELGALVNRWKRVAEGSSAAVALVGPAGLGKSHLVEKVLTRTDHPASVTAQGDATRTASPFAALQPALRQLLAQPDLEPMLGPDLLADAQRAAGLMDMEGRRDGAVAAAAALFGVVATTHPLLVVVEDVHWLDPSSAEAVARAARSDHPGLMFLMTARQMPDAPGWDAIEAQHLKALTDTEAHSLVATLQPDATAEERNELVQRATGNPFFLVWMSRVAAAADDFTGVRRLLRPRSGVPAVVQQAVRSQIDGSGVADDITTMAAVIGMDFSTPLLAAALDRPQDDVDHAVMLLNQHDIVKPVRENQFRFSHHLVHELAYDLLLSADCRQRHGQVADTLEAQNSEDFATLGMHHDRARRPLEASLNKLRAAQNCRHSNAYREGAELVTRVLELVNDETSQLPDEIKLQALELHGTLAASVDGQTYAAGTSDKSGVLDLLDPVEDIRRITMAKTRDWGGAMLAGDMAQSIRLLYEVWRSAKDQFPEIEVCNRNARGLHASYRGRYAHAERLMESSSREMGQHGVDPWLLENWGTTDDPIALGQSYAPPILYQRGRLTTAKELLNMAWHRAESIPGSAHSMVHVGSNAAIFWEFVGEGHAAMTNGQQVAELGHDLGLDFWEFNGNLHAKLGRALMEPNPALLTELEGEAQLVASFSPMAAGRFFLTIAGLALQIHDTDMAGRCLQTVVDVSETTGMQYLDAECLRLRAVLATGNEQIELLTQAVRLAALQGATRYHLRALVDLVKLNPQHTVGDVNIVEALDDAIASWPEPEGDPDVDTAMQTLMDSQG